MSTTIAKWSKLSGFGLFGLCLSLGACGDSPSSDSGLNGGQSYGEVEAALENPVLKCEQDQAMCRQAAKDPKAEAACGDTMRMCLAAAAMEGEKSAMALEQCRTTAAECVGKGGPTGVMTCRDDYEKCVEGVTGAMSGGPATGVPGLPQLPQLPRAGRPAPRLPVGGGLAFPGFPGAPGGARPPRLPAAGAPARPQLPGLPQAGRAGLPNRGGNGEAAKCFTTLRECVRAPGKDPNQCATEARACLKGSTPTTPTMPTTAGAGGAAGGGR